MFHRRARWAASELSVCTPVRLGSAHRPLEPWSGLLLQISHKSSVDRRVVWQLPDSYMGSRFWLRKSVLRNSFS